MDDDKNLFVRFLDRWPRFITPCVIAIILCFVGIVISMIGFEESGGWSFLGVIILLPAALFLLLIDFLVKLIFKDRLYYIWLTELPLIAVGIFIFFTFIYG